MLRWTVWILVAGAFAAPAFATSLVNKDDVAYRYAVRTDKSVASAVIGARSVAQDICPPTAAVCIVTIDAIGEIEVTGADDVVIRARRLSKQ